MARITRPEAAKLAAELQLAIARLQDNVRAELAASSGYTTRSAKQLRMARNGQRHELDTASRLVNDLVAGLAGIGPATNGQLGGQRQGGHDTSAEALRLVAPRAGTQRALVLAKLRQWAGEPTEPAGLTDVQLARMTGLQPNSLRPRRVELVDAGWLEDSGRRRIHNGREHVVWTLTEAARHTGDTPTTEEVTAP